MSIRKILGAGFGNVWLSLSRDFLRPVFIAFLVVVPMAVWVMQSMLSTIPYHVNVSWWMFAFAGLLSVIIALVTVSYQGIKTAFENPVIRLRNE